MSSAGAPPNQAATQPVKAPDSAPTNTPPDGSDLQTPPDPAGASTPPADDPTPSSGPADPYCKVLESVSGAGTTDGDGKDDGPDADSPEAIAAAQKTLRGIADQAPAEIRPSMQVVANLLPRADSDDFSQADMDQLAAAQKIVGPWLLKHCPGSDLAGLRTFHLFQTKPKE
ncbi:hypothetical protein [Kribbella sp. NPDC006257]|uniref:hypothetical protein n=1 Tax=Kribbella sp. NPDC006257 TaxID=3156738 RepID=UPI0033B2C0B0